MAFPSLQIPRAFVYFDDTLSFLFQSTTPSTGIEIRIFKKTDTLFTTPLYTDLTQVTDGNGDFTGAIVTTQAILANQDFYVLQVILGSTISTANFALSRIANYLNLIQGILGSLMHVPRHDEVGHLNLDLTEVTWGYGNWQLTPVPVVTVNEDTQLSSADIKFQYVTGKGFLELSPSSGDEFRADYNFAYFDDQTLYTYFRTTLHEVNRKPPTSAFTLESAPVGFEAIIVLGSYIKALRKLLIDLQLFQWRRIFENPDGLQAIAQAMMAAAEAEYLVLLAYYKRRGSLRPAVIRGNDVSRMPALIDQSNWKNFTILA